MKGDPRLIQAYFDNAAPDLIQTRPERSGLLEAFVAVFSALADRNKVET